MENHIPEKESENKAGKTDLHLYKSWFEENIKSRSDTTNKRLPMRWFLFWTYFWLPISVVRSAMYIADPANPIIWKIYAGLMATFSIPIIIGLHKRKNWGWSANFAFISCHTFIAITIYYYSNRYMDMWGHYADKPPSGTTLFWWFFWIILWLLPFFAQYAYWKRRRHLFT